MNNPGNLRKKINPNGQNSNSSVVVQKHSCCSPIFEKISNIFLINENFREIIDSF